MPVLPCKHYNYLNPVRWADEPSWAGSEVPDPLVLEAELFEGIEDISKSGHWLQGDFLALCLTIILNIHFEALHLQKAHLSQTVIFPLAVPVSHENKYNLENVSLV